MDIAALINQTSFPIAIAVYMLYRENKQRQVEIDNAVKMTAALNRAAEVIESAQAEIAANRAEREELKQLLLTKRRKAA